MTFTIKIKMLLHRILNLSRTSCLAVFVAFSKMWVRMAVPCIFLFTMQAEAQVFSLLGVETRFAEDSTREFKLEIPMLIAVGYKKESWLFFGEALYFKESDREGALSIENKHLEVTAYTAYFIDYQTDRFLNPYIIAGLGAFKNYLKYEFSGTSSKDDTLWEPVLKLGGGLWSEVTESFIFNLEAKAMYSEKLNPDLMFEATLRVGLLF